MYECHLVMAEVMAMVKLCQFLADELWHVRMPVGDGLGDGHGKTLPLLG